MICSFLKKEQKRNIDFVSKKDFQIKVNDVCQKGKVHFVHSTSFLFSETLKKCPRILKDLNLCVLELFVFKMFYIILNVKIFFIAFGAVKAPFYFID